MLIISKLVETKANSKYLIGYLDQVTRHLNLKIEIKIKTLN